MGEERRSSRTFLRKLAETLFQEVLQFGRGELGERRHIVLDDTEHGAHGDQIVVWRVSADELADGCRKRPNVARSACSCHRNDFRRHCSLYSSTAALLLKRSHQLTPIWRSVDIIRGSGETPGRLDGMNLQRHAKVGKLDVSIFSREHICRCTGRRQQWQK